jgi:hypothetical protein
MSFIGSKKGAKDPEYQEAAARNQKALASYQEAQLKYGETYLKTENKITEEMRKRNEEYQKLQVSALDASGKYVEAEGVRQEMDKNSIEYLRLLREEEEGVASAIVALANIEKKRAIDNAAAQNKENEERRNYAQSVAMLRDELDKLQGKDAELMEAESKLRDGRDKMAVLQDKLNLAWAQGNAIAINGLSMQIQLQDQLNQRLQSQRSFMEQVKVLSGQIVGFNGNTPIYANGGGMFANGEAVEGYRSPTAALASQRSNSPSSGFDSGIRFVDINGKSSGSGNSVSVGDINVYPAQGEKISDATVREIATQLQKLNVAV